ncbi:MAG: triose-phosphate isomerase [Flavobacteriales bacterium]|nr:triose-phosphate isomerase [Flavobacteriales bacterium]
MRNKLVIGNWKMNKTLEEALELVVRLKERSDEFPGGVEVVLAPPSLYLGSIAMMEEPWHKLSAQNCSHHDYGAFTGEISAPMLHAMSIDYCIVGHSERRTYYHEDDALLASKVDACIRHGVIPVFCCGEHLEQRRQKEHFVTVLQQLQKGLFHLTPAQFQSIVIAYEPVWAIGTGQTASPEQAQEMHAFIREEIGKHFGSPAANAIRILYGGSVNATNAGELMSCADIDGALVGGASLHARDFATIITSAA